MMDDQTVRCARCGRPSPESIPGDVPIDWEALDEDSMICDGCVTGAEQQAADEDWMALDSAGSGRVSVAIQAGDRCRCVISRLQ